MRRDYHRWDSPALGRPMELLVFGHAGAPVLVFPTSLGRFHEYEDFGMVDAVRHQIEQGWMQLICLDSIDNETWFNYGADTDARMWRYDQYEHYLLTEVLPLIRSINPTPYLIATGCSLGATNAMIFALRHPGVVNRVLGMHGLYDMKRFFPNYTEALYFHSPIDFIPNLDDHHALEQLRQMDLIIISDQEDAGGWTAQALSGALWSKGIGNALRVWDGWNHDWPYWKQMINMYIGGHD